MKKLLILLALIFVAFTVDAQSDIQLSCPDDNHPHAIDLGLPSGTKWACCNVDATKPEEYGGYYAWGETSEKSRYYWDTYKFCNGTWDTCRDIGVDIAGGGYDVAHVKWGDSWQMPNDSRFKELINNCYNTWTTLDGVNGSKFTSKINGNSIFLPASGVHYSDYIEGVGTDGKYYSSSRYFDKRYEAPFFNIKSATLNHMNRCYGLSIRPICVPSSSYSQYCPDENHPHIVDLGLPSGTKWACCNVGANKPEAKGGYYAWGETETKSKYDWNTYIHGDGSSDLGSDIAGTQYDVAHVKWGGSWVMPSKEQQDELIANCSYEWINGSPFWPNGGLFTGPNGNKVFLYADGYRHHREQITGISQLGYYWSSTPYSSIPNCSYSLNFDSDDTRISIGAREFGECVRPVISGTNNIYLSKSTTDIYNQAIYNLYGLKVADNINTLPPGIYIVNSKKMVIK